MGDLALRGDGWPAPAADTLGMLRLPLFAATLLLSLLAFVLLAAASAHAAPVGPLAQRLSATGLFVAGSSEVIAPGVFPFTPQYALWSDGADKRRWIRLPPGSAIDARHADAWEFPPGTQLWKEFSHAGRRIETRLIERLPDRSWRYASYVWTEDGSEAWLAPEAGLRALARAEAPEGRYEVPSRSDCLACHEGAPVPVLGFTALLLSPARDTPARPGDIDLPGLAARGLLRGLDPALLLRAPRIVAASAAERAALGYLHANCSHCHNHNGRPVPLTLAQTAQGNARGQDHARVLASLIDVPSRFQGTGARIVEPGDPAGSLLLQRMRSRAPLLQMPPLGSRHPDPEGLALIARWIAALPPKPKELSP